MTTHHSKRLLGVFAHPDDESFRPEVVITFGSDGGYGHPDHMAISAATTAACQRSGDRHQFPEQMAAGLAPHHPEQLYHSHFPPRPQLLLNQLVQWLVQAQKRFQGNLEFVYALLLLCEEASLLHYSRDHFDVSWYPTGFSIIEQDEVADSLYLILSGTVEVIREAVDGTLQVLARLGPGAFFGEEGLAYQRPRNAHVVAAENVTCLVLSPEAPTAFFGRGEDAHLTGSTKVAEQDENQIMAEATCIDVGPYIEHKIEAIAAHRSQFPIQPHMLPHMILEELMGQEYFVRVFPVVGLKQEFPASANDMKSA